MLIFPVEHKVDLRKPPYITFLLIVLNCFIYFFVQGDDEQTLNQAAEFYVANTIYEKELALYKGYARFNEPEALEELYPFQKHRDPLADADAHAAKSKFLLALMEFLHGG